MRGLGFGPTPTQMFGHNTNTFGRVPFSSTPNSSLINSMQKKIDTLESALQASTERQKTTNDALIYLLQKMAGGIPPEFAHLMNSQVSSLYFRIYFLLILHLI